jgi:phosphatidylserine/phosphatidylglycerophosphate/cardiolipin synthase-like enzyme
MIAPMKRLATALALALTVGGTAVQAQPRRVESPELSRPWAAYFSPDGGATQAVVEALGRAHHSVLVQAETLSSPQITKALADAGHRGVKVQIILDRRHAKGRPSSAETLARDGIGVLIDRVHTTGTNMMVIDTEVVLTGSFGYTVAAEQETVENLLVIHAPALAARYGESWQLHAAHSTRYTP